MSNQSVKACCVSPIPHSISILAIFVLSIIGGVLSVIVIVCTWSAAEFPHASVKDQVLEITNEP